MRGRLPRSDLDSGPGVELLDNIDRRSGTDVTFDAAGAGAGRGQMVVLAAAVVGLVLWLVSSGLGSSTADALPELETTVPPTEPLELVNPDRTDPRADRIDEREAAGEAGGDGLTVAGQDPSRLAELGVELHAVVASRTGEGARLLSVTDSGETSAVELPNLSRFSFDRSGEWMAGVGVGTVGDRQLTLWAGPVGGELEPIAVGISSYVWHDTEGGRIAWTGRDRRSLTMSALDGSIDTGQLDIASQGWLTGWGEWGFAIETSRRNFVTDVMGPDGVKIVGELPGRFRGRPSPGLLLFGGGDAGPVLYDIESASISAVPWLDTDDDVWRLVASETAGPSVALVIRDGNRSRPVSGVLLLLDAGSWAETGRAVGGVQGHTDVKLIDGGAILLVDQVADDSEQAAHFTVIDAPSDSGEPPTTHTVPVPDVLPGPEWVVAIGV